MIFILCSSCNEKISYSGKVFNEENINYNELKNKGEVINKLGNPNFIDPFEKKYYYFSEKRYKKNFYKQKITNRTMVVFIFNENETIKLVSQYDLNDEQDVKYIKEKTSNEIIKRGLINKIFGGVGQPTPSTSQ
jgi:outer membrane protein assembly factor BamE (lipoprotein component of BamABCDE complex)|tara:strand:+ start:4239 stop:4640 length:402 start_codon:yes stop_codon:yes gene_type:complete